MATKALLVGINAYTTIPLRGCVNDVVRMHDLLDQRYGMTNDRVRIITDTQATKAAIVDGLRWLAQTDPDETAPMRLFHFSGHGTFVADENNEEPDGRDECLAPYDYLTAGHITDDILHDSYMQFSASTHLLLLMDCCHSGASQRDVTNDVVYRYLKGTDEQEALLLRQIQAVMQRNRGLKEAYVGSKMTDMLRQEPASMTEDELHRQIGLLIKQFDDTHYHIEAVPGNATLIAACQSDQTAADAHFGETYNGALTYHLTEALASTGNQLSYKALIAQLGLAMRERFIQVPQLECSNECVDLPFLQAALR